MGNWGGHYSVCYEYPLDCTNGCGATGIKRKAMCDHRSSCPLDPLDCLFKDAGCTEKIARKDMEDHMTANQQKHMLMTFQLLNHTKSELQNTKQEFNSTKKELQSTKQDVDCTKQELHDTKQELQDTKEDLDNTKRELCHIKQELADTKRELDDTKREVKDTKQELYYTKRELHDTKEKPHETKKGSSFEVQKMEALCRVGNTATFQMTDFTRLRNEKKVWHSPLFSVSDKVRVRLAVDPNGYGKGQGTHVSVSLILVEVVKKEEDMYLECSVLVTAIGQHGLDAHKKLELCTNRVKGDERSDRYFKPPCPACFPLPSPGEVLKSEERFLDIEEVNYLLENDAMTLELELRTHYCYQ